MISRAAVASIAPITASGITWALYATHEATLPVQPMPSHARSVAPLTEASWPARPTGCGCRCRVPGGRPRRKRCWTAALTRFPLRTRTRTPAVVSRADPPRRRDHGGRHRRYRRGHLELRCGQLVPGAGRHGARAWLVRAFGALRRVAGVRIHHVRSRAAAIAVDTTRSSRLNSEVVMRHTMRPLCSATLLSAVMALAPSLSAQATGQRTRELIQASYNAHQGDFDYLLGDWEFTSVSREFGKGRGYWSAVRLAEGAQILDEYRVVGDSGQTYYVTNTLRAYNAVLDQWDLISTEQGTGLQNVGTAHKVGPEMHIEQKFGVMSPNPSLWRIRYYDIGPDRFSWTGDRSIDGGKTWTAKWLQIEARRIGPPRSLGPLAPAKR